MLNSLINPKAVGEVCKDIGQILFASVFLTSLMGDAINYLIVILGLVLSVFFWSLYIITRKY
jgi:hypothetical protein